MWILPKTLTQSNGSLATVETISDLNECSRICASSLLVRSKSSPSKTFLRRWKQDTWRRLPFGRIAKPSLGNHSLIERIFLSRPILASHLAQPANGKAPTTSGTYGHTFTDGYYAPDLFSSSLRTSKDTYRWDSPQSSAIWKKEVTRRRGEYSARLKSGRLIKERESLFWPSVVATEVRQGFQDRSRGKKGSQESLTTAVVMDNWTTPTPWQQEESLDSWEARKAKNKAKGYNGNGQGTPLDMQVKILGHQDRESRNTNGNRPELWRTPNAQLIEAKPPGTKLTGRTPRDPQVGLADQALYWRTPQAQEAGAKVETLFTKDGRPAMPGQRAYRKTPSGKLVLQSQTINQQVEMAENH